MLVLAKKDNLQFVIKNYWDVNEPNSIYFCNKTAVNSDGQVSDIFTNLTLP